MEQVSSRAPGRAASLALVQAVLLIVGGVIGAIVSAALENQAIGWLLWPAVVMVLAVLAAIGGWLDPRRIGRGWSRIVAVIASIAAIAFAWWSASAATGAWIQVVSIALIWLTATAASWGAFSSTSTWPRVALSTAIITLVVALAGQVIALLSRDDLYTWVGFVAALMFCVAGVVLSIAFLVGRSILVGFAAVIVGVAAFLLGVAALSDAVIAQRDSYQYYGAAGFLLIGISCCIAGLARLLRKPILYGVGLTLFGVSLIGFLYVAVLADQGRDIAPLALYTIGIGFTLYGVSLLANSVTLSAAALFIMGIGPAWIGGSMLLGGPQGIDLLLGLGLLLVSVTLVASGIALAVSWRNPLARWWARVHSVLSRGREPGENAISVLGREQREQGRPRRD